MKALIALLICWPLWALAGDAAQARLWIDRMSNAMKTLNYEGTFVHFQNNQVEAMRIYHGVDDEGEYERLLSLTGAAREIIRDNDMLTCILPDSRSVVAEKSRPRQYIPQALVDAGSRLERFYQFRLLGKDRMVGMPARVLDIMPRDQYRYGYRLWLDEKTGLLLKSDLINEHGEAVEQMMFTSIRLLNRMPKRQLQPALIGKDFQWFSDHSSKTIEVMPEKKAWSVSSLPEGFMLSMYKDHGMPASKMPVEHLMFSDGLSSVSVYIEKPEQVREVLKGVSRMGAMNAYGTMVAGHQVTVMGEVPQAAVIMIGDAVQYNPQHEQHD